MVRLFSILAFALITTLQIRAQQAMSLEDCVQYAIAHHPDITLAKLDIRDADWQIKENTAVALPQFTAGISYQHYLQQPAIPASAFGFEADPGTKFTFALKNQISGTIGVDQLLFNHSYLLGIKAAKEYRKYVGLKMEAAKANLRNNVTDAYLPALLLDENLAILNKNIGIQERLLKETREVNKAGFAEQLDVDRIDYTLATLKTQRDNLVRQRDILVDLLKFAIHMPVSEDIAMSDDLTKLLDAYADILPDEDLDYMNRPEYVSLLKARELSDIQVDLYDKNWLPSLSGFAQYQPSYQGNEELFWIPAAVIGVRLNIPIYDGGLANAKKERAVVTALQVDVQKETLEHAYDLELATARKQYANASARIRNEEGNLQLAQRIYDTTQTKFQAGVGSSFEVTQAQANLYQSQAQLMEAQYEMLQARVALKKVLGK